MPKLGKRTPRGERVMGPAYRIVNPRRARYYTAIAAGLFLIPTAPAPQVAATEQCQPPGAAALAPTEPAEHVKIEGFRSAHWGIDAAQVKVAVQKDFGIPTEEVKTEENPAERTTLLSVTVNDLLEGAGPARVSYVLGFNTKSLIQVNILWGTPVDPGAQPEKIVAASNQLRQLFFDSGYEPETIITNARMADGSILVFQGQDAAKHTTVLRLAGGSGPVATKGPEEGQTVTVTLSLSYILDIRNPDIFRLKKGQF